MTEFVDALRSAPAWAQFMVAVLAAAILASAAGPAVRRRRARQAFERLAAARGATITPVDGVTATFSWTLPAAVSRSTATGTRGP